MSESSGMSNADAIATRRDALIPDDHSFALCLTHDVDRPYKTYQSLYYAVTERDPSHLRSLLPGRNPYWSFEKIMQLEDELGVRSSFNFLDEQYLFTDRPIETWLDPESWMLYTGRYSMTDQQIIELIHELDGGGWEIGLHGSYDSYRDRERLRDEKRRLESILGRSVPGIRQHHLNLEIPETWKHHREIGLSYDTSLGSASEYGFEHGYGIERPFDDSFVVFPLTLMELALPVPDFERSKAACEALLTEAKENAAVMTVLWHPRFFCSDTPEYEPLYRRLIERALEMNAWVGPPGELYERIEHP